MKLPDCLFVGEEGLGQNGSKRFSSPVMLLGGFFSSPLSPLTNNIMLYMANLIQITQSPVSCSVEVVQNLRAFQGLFL